MQTATSIIGLICFVVVTVDVWRSPATTGKKVIWTVVALIFSVVALIVWLVWGRRNAYGSSNAGVA